MHPAIKRAREMLARLEGVEFEYANEHAQRDPNAEDALLAWDAAMPKSSKQQRSSSELIYKTYQPPVQQQSTPAMDEKTAESWNSWLVSYVEKAIGANNEALADALGGKTLASSSPPMFASVSMPRPQSCAKKLTHCAPSSAGSCASMSASNWKSCAPS